MVALRSTTTLLIAVVLSSQNDSAVAWMNSNGIASVSTRNRMRTLTAPFPNPTRPSLSCQTLSRLGATTIDATSSTAPQIQEPEENKITLLPPKPPSNDDDLGLSIEQKILNALFLSAAFGYAVYTILNIDSGMTRGWTGSEIAMRIPLDNWGAYESYLANKPVFTKTLINVIIYLLGDWLSQTVFQGKNVLNFDLSRTLRNGFIGLCFGPLVHEYYQFSDSILPPENGLVTRLEKILMDQSIYLTVKCSMYISAVGLLGGDDWPTVKETVKDKIGGVVITAWKFWPIVHCITYGLIPARHRILWVNSVDLVWNAILATQAQKTPPAEEDDEAPSSLTTHVDSQALHIEQMGDLMEELKEEALETSHVVVLDNQWVEDQKEAISDIISHSPTASRNTTAEAVATA